MIVLVILFYSGTSICLCCTTVECKSKNSLSDGLQDERDDVFLHFEQISDFEEFPEPKYPKFEVPSFNNFFSDVSKTDDFSMHALNNIFPMDLKLPILKPIDHDLHLKTLIEKMKKPIKLNFKDDFLKHSPNITNMTNSISRMKSETLSSHCALVAGKININIL